MAAALVWLREQMCLWLDLDRSLKRISGEEKKVRRRSFVTGLRATPTRCVDVCIVLDRDFGA